MKEGSGEVNQGTQVVKTASQAFVEIEKQIKSMVHLIEDSSRSIENVAKESILIEDTNRSLSQISQQIAGQNESVSAATEQQLATTEEIMSASRELSQMAEKLYETINKFKI